MQFSIEFRDDRSNRPGHQSRKRFKDGYRFSERARHGGKFEADESSANDCNFSRVPQPFFHNLSFIKRTQIKDPIELRAFEGQRTIASTNSKYEFFVGKMPA